MSDFFNFIKTSFFEEASRWVIWLPVFLGVGIILYFSLTQEPSWYVPLISMVVFVLAWMVFRRNLAIRTIILCVFLIPLGFSAAKYRSENIYFADFPKIEHPITLSGNIESITYSRNFPRLVLTDLRIDELEPHQIPKKIRLNVRTEIRGENVQPGDRVITAAILNKPPRPAIPNGYDFGRWAYFHEIGAIGFPIQPVTKLKWGHKGNNVEAIRYSVTEKVLAAIEGQAGGIAAALITGERSRIDETTKQMMRDSGLAHILAISGLHLALVTGVIFFIFRILLSSNSALSERFSTKKIAAILAIFGSFAYLLLAGMPISAQRAFLMVSLILLAIILDRSPTPMRSVAFAAFVILLATPESIMSPGFQMSFMAVICLISLYEFLFKCFPRLFLFETDKSRLKAFGKLFMYPFSVMLTAIFAGFATAPYAAYHFNRYTVYGLIANLVAIPVLTFVVMPMAVLSTFLMFFGLEEYSLMIMGYGIDAIIWIAKKVSILPEAVQFVPQFSVTTLCLFTFGMLWLFIWHKKWRLLGLIPIAIAFIVMANIEKPDIYIKENGKLFAIKMNDKLYFSNRRKTFASGEWAASFGQEKILKLEKDKQGIYQEIRDKITLDMLEENGTYLVYIDRGNIRLENVAQNRGQRLWTR